MATATLLSDTGHNGHNNNNNNNSNNNNNNHHQHGGYNHAKQKCTSATCCSPSRLWRSVQQLISENNKQDLIKLCQDPNKGSHVLRVLLTSRLTNDASLYPASHKHKVVQLVADNPQGSVSSDGDLLFRSKVNATFGKSVTDLNALQLALFHRQEGIACYLLQHIRQHASDKEMALFVNHLWGNRNGSLHLACFLGMSRVVQLLLEMGVAPDVVNGRLKTPLDCCSNESHGLHPLNCHDLVQQALSSKIKDKSIEVDMQDDDVGDARSLSDVKLSSVPSSVPSSGSLDGDTNAAAVKTLNGKLSNKKAVALSAYHESDARGIHVKPAKPVVRKSLDTTTLLPKAVDKAQVARAWTAANDSIVANYPPPPSVIMMPPPLHWSEPVQMHSFGNEACFMDTSTALLQQAGRQQRKCGLDDMYSPPPLVSSLLGYEEEEDDDDDDDDDDSDDDVEENGLDDQGNCWPPPTLSLVDDGDGAPLERFSTSHEDNSQEEIPSSVTVETSDKPQHESAARKAMDSPYRRSSDNMDSVDGRCLRSKPISTARPVDEGFPRQDSDRPHVHFDPKAVIVEACIRGDLRELKNVLKQYGIDTSWLLDDHHGGQDRTLLQLALMHGHEPIVRYLVNQVKVNLNQVDADGWTALHYAAALGQWKNIEYLASSDLIDLFAETDDGFMVHECPGTEMDRIRCRLLLGRILKRMAMFTKRNVPTSCSASTPNILHSPTLVDGYT